MGVVPLFDQRGATFNRVANGDGANGRRFDIGAFEFVPTSLAAADFHIDGDVDGLDFLAWQRGFGLAVGATRAQGNADGDGGVDGADLAVWEAEFGDPVGVTAAEPAVAAALVTPPQPSPSRGGGRMDGTLTPQAVDAALAYQQMLAEAALRRPYRPRLLRPR